VIIFLCPVSCFDERLDEDVRVNRLEDSTLLWRSICSSKLLTKTQLILFLVRVFPADFNLTYRPIEQM
jgi:guanine nucleotide-binding protein subunit alpha